MRRTFDALLAAALSAICAVAAAAVGTNFSDQWWNPAESGWGASILQQSDILFVALFVDSRGRGSVVAAAATTRYECYDN